MAPDDPVSSVSVVFTIGHGRDDFGAFTERCRPHGVRTIVDVRSAPYSRHAPDFTKARLERLCAEAGLGYRWMGATLGGRPDGVEGNAGLAAGSAPADPDSAGFAAGISELEGLIHAGPVVVLCAETDPERCHRAHIIAPALIERGHRVAHITADGTVASHQPQLEL
ncbi:MAG: DUF488 family protein [Acidimicrobiia bacterium]